VTGNSAGESLQQFREEAIMRNAAARSNLLVPEVREVMDIRQASDYLGISPDTLYKYASEGFVPAFKLGNRWRFKRSRLDEWMDRQSDKQATESELDAGRKKPVQPAF
jgi:excisionase family DNA binding protein